MRKTISFFTSRHLLTNVIFFGLILLCLFFWQKIGKEEMPEFAFDWVNISVSYPGASAEDVELMVTKPIEDELKGVTGIEDIRSTSSQGASSLTVFIDPDYPDLKEVVQEIKDATLRVNLPTEIRNLPTFRQFKSSEKAIMDVAFIHKTKEFLDDQSRIELQKYVLNFENQLTSLKEISSVSRTAYLKPEVHIFVDPKKLQSEEISLTKIQNQIIENNIRTPIGSLSDQSESKITALNELEDKKSLDDLILRGNYQGHFIRLGEIASIKNGFERKTSITKINAKEGVFLNIKKSMSTDILTAQKKTIQFIEKFKRSNRDAPVEIYVMDDESFDVTNRLNIITSNGIIGFFLLLAILFLFLNFKSGFWVAMGIPFSMAFTLTIAFLTGYTINNMTLAGVIIVLGIVVDDAIVIAENMMSKVEQGLDDAKAAIEGTAEVVTPIIASVATTAVVFIPLLFFEGHFGKFVKYIPLVITLMLLGSLLESLFILPSHLSAKSKRWGKSLRTKEIKKSWFKKYEILYKNLLLKIFKKRIYILFIFIILLAGASYLFSNKMKFVMFPREESKEMVIKVKTPKGTTREKTAKMIGKIENIFVGDKENVVAVRSSTAKGRRGGEVRDNEATILVELIPADKRKTSLNKLIKGWKARTDQFKEFASLKFIRGRWGHSSGSAIEILIQENDDQKRAKIAAQIKENLIKFKGIEEVEIEKPLIKREYLFSLKQNNLVRFEIDPKNVTDALRAYVEGTILYSVNKGEEEVDVRLSVPSETKYDLNDLLNLSVENKAGRLVSLHKLVEIKEIQRPLNITRFNFKRTTMIYGDLKGNAKVTPLDIAEKMENDVFPEIYNQFPTTILKFVGEIEDSRDSQGDFESSIGIALLLIYFILLIIFNSLTTPLLVLSIVPFGFAGVVYILMAHGMKVFGFFAVVGTLGMIGVVINDAIIMISKIESSLKEDETDIQKTIAEVSATRLRPVLLTTITTVVGIIPTAYGWSGFDSMLAEMMLTMGWGLAFGTCITLLLIPIFYSYLSQFKSFTKNL